MDRTAQLSPLGLQRLRLLDCLGGNSPHAAGYFEPVPGTDIFDAFRQYVARICQAWSAESDAMTVSLLATARFLTGELDAANIIINHLPANAFKLDHGAGYCVVMPQTALRTSLPLPSKLTDIDRWLAGSVEQAALRTWLTENLDRLSWDGKKGIYHLDQRC
jgi:hypothetical protein